MKLSLILSALVILGQAFFLMPVKHARPSQPQQTKQEVVSSFETYAKWRKDFLEKLPNGKGIPHYSMAVVVQRLDINTAKIELTMVGRTIGNVLEIRPLYVDVTAGDQSDGLPAGSESTTRDHAGKESSEINPIREHEFVIPVDASANAVEVKWTPEGDKSPGPYTMLLPLKDAPTSSVAGSMPCEQADPTGTSNGEKDAVPAATCQWITSRCVSCGADPFVLCCLFGTGIKVNCVTCTASCLTKCPPNSVCVGRPPA